MASAAPPADEAQVTCRFVTTLPAALRITPTPFALPARLTRYGLSEVVNHLMALDPPMPFDFIVEGELVRSSLEKIILAKRLSAETVLTIEYLPAVGPPTLKAAPPPQRDWLGALDASLAGPSLLSGWHDGAGRLLDAVSSGEAAGRVLAELLGHSDALTCVVRVAADRALTASKDHSLRLWALPTGKAAKAAAASAAPASLASFAVLRGHGDAVESAAASPDGGRACSGSWDTTVRLWELPEDAAAAAAVSSAAEPDAGGPAAKKRRRGAEAAAVIESGVTLEGHTQCVAAVLWPEPALIVSGSWDHSVRCWDLAGAAPAPGAQLHTTGAVLCLSAATRAAPGAGLLALGTSDRQVRVWDPRAGSSSAAAPLLGTHGGFVSSVRWCPHSAHHVLSTSHDGSLRLWDLRSRVPLHTLPAAHGPDAKVLAADWLGEDAVVSGGTDCRLLMHELHIGSAGPAGGA